MSNKIGGAVCIAIAFGLYTFNENLQAAVVANKNLANWIKDDNNCPALDWNTATVSEITEGCHYWNSDFKLLSNLTDDLMNAAVLPETMQCHNLVYERGVAQYQEFEQTVCPGDPNYRGGEPSESWRSAYDSHLAKSIFDLQGKPQAKKAEEKSNELRFRTSEIDSLDAKTRAAYESANARSDCYTETVTDWVYDVDAGLTFPSADPVDHGFQTKMPALDNHQMIQPGNGTVSSNSVHFNFATLFAPTIPGGAAAAQVFARASGPMHVIDPIEGQFYGNATDEDFRTGIDNNPYYFSDGTAIASNSLCFSPQAADVWTSTSPATDGLTTAEFQGHSYYGDLSYFPRCDNPIVGDYRVQAKCNGYEHDNTLVIAGISKENFSGDDYLVAGIYKNADFPDTTEVMETAFFSYGDGAETKETVIEAYIVGLDELAAATEGMTTIGMAIFGLMGLGAIFGKKESSSSSSSK